MTALAWRAGGAGWTRLLLYLRGRDDVGHHVAIEPVLLLQPRHHLSQPGGGHERRPRERRRGQNTVTRPRTRATSQGSGLGGTAARCPTGGFQRATGSGLGGTAG
eukprot:1743356-Prymnesium_polylepis.1